MNRTVTLTIGDQILSQMAADWEKQKNVRVVSMAEAAAIRPSRREIEPSAVARIGAVANLKTSIAPPPETPRENPLIAAVQQLAGKNKKGPLPNGRS